MTAKNMISIIVLQCFLLCVSSSRNPSISHISLEQIKNIGGNVQLNCTVDNVEDYSVGWAKIQDSGSVVLAIRSSLTLNDKRYSVTEQKNGTSSTYSFQITNLEVSDIGVYECQVIISPSEKVNAKVNLLIRHPAYILENLTPKAYTISEGKNEDLICQGEGYPKPSISWSRLNNEVMPAGGNIHHGNILKLKSANRLDRGIYLCTADNGLGKPDKKVIKVDIEFPPFIRVPRPKLGQTKTYGIELECDVEGYPAPSISWYKNGIPLQSVGNYRITNMATSNEVTSSVFRISSVDSSNYGDYFCNATNYLGHSEARVSLFEAKKANIYFPVLINTSHKLLLPSYLILLTFINLC